MGVFAKRPTKRRGWRFGLFRSEDLREQHTHRTLGGCLLCIERMERGRTVWEKDGTEEASQGIEWGKKSSQKSQNRVQNKEKSG